ncbi:MAG TPA: 3-isopropylmalate dehydratase small subunit [Terriglobales bacterium]|jgi:3-isopropylmalate/(R)-2-methylmalate dehydratase small subunit|nr:3-isopropylmalate dehydratase small subunit [Terriglobales bacterium]
MQAFRIHTGRVAPLDRANVDTDQIIPKQFLKRIERSGYGQFLFYDWRYLADGKLDPSFVLNHPRYAGASVLVAGKNFGCGSSREHAPWALLDYGFRTIIAPSFADIFATNCTKNGILPVVLSETQVAELVLRTTQFEGYFLTIDLEKREVRDQSDFLGRFEIDDFKRTFLLEGLDDIGLTLQHENDITLYERQRRAFATPLSS